MAVAIDPSGNLYVAENDNNLIRKITPGGDVTTLAGQALVAGSATGTGASAQFNKPSGLVLSGPTLYVADTGNHVIRKVTTDGSVSGFVGSVGVPGNTNRPGNAARFNRPQGVAVDSGGNVFIADTANSSIRKVTPAGVVSLLAGKARSPGGADGSGAAARFRAPAGLSLGAGNSLYVTDAAGHTVRKIASAGVVSTLAGRDGAAGSADGDGRLSAQFSSPSGAVVDGNGNIFVSDSANGTIRKVTSSGAVTTVAGTAGGFGTADGIGAAARFYRPVGIARDGGNNLYVADPVAQTIRKITSDGAVSTFAGYPAVVGANDGTGSLAGFRGPSGIVADRSGNLYIADRENHTIRMVTPAGVATTFAGRAGEPGSADGVGAGARFNGPTGLAIDANGNVYVADTGNHTIRMIAPGGGVTTIAGSVGRSGFKNAAGTAALFNSPAALAVFSGNLYVADTGNYTIRRIILSSRKVTTLAGRPRRPGAIDSPRGTQASFGLVHGMAVDSTGNIFVADHSASTIRKITPAGAVTTFAGMANSRGTANGTGTAARLSGPHGMALDAANNIYVADYANCTIRKITAVAVVSTPIGTPGTCKFTPAAAPSAINAPRGLAVVGNALYFTAGNGVAKVENMP